MLKPLPEQKAVPEVEYGSDSPIMECEACGKQGPRHLMINLLIGISSPGHPKLLSVGCPMEHWACSRECWLLIAHECLDGHVHELLKRAHQSVNL